MNINNVYLCEIARCLGRNNDGSYKCEHLKYALVYHTKDGKWIDLKSKQKYDYGLYVYHSYYEPMFINDSGIMVPIKDVIDTRRNHMTKRKIYKEVDKKVKESSNEESI